MKTPLRSVAMATLGLVLAFLHWPGAEAGGQGKGKEPILPDKAFLEIVREANKFIQEALAKARPTPSLDDFPAMTIRANALLIALAAQNRMKAAGAASNELATLRDAALKLAAAAQNKPRNLADVRKHAEILNRYPNLKADPDAQPGLVRLKNLFDHDPISHLFGSCSGRKGHAIEFEILKLTRQKDPLTRTQAEKLELLACKVALIGELLQDFDDLFPVQKQEKRKEWARLAGDVHTIGWQLAESARAQNAAAMQQGINKLNGVCIACHSKFRD